MKGEGIGIQTGGSFGVLLKQPVKRRVCIIHTTCALLRSLTCQPMSHCNQGKCCPLQAQHSMPAASQNRTEPGLGVLTFLEQVSDMQMSKLSSRSSSQCTQGGCPQLPQRDGRRYTAPCKGHLSFKGTQLIWKSK